MKGQGHGVPKSTPARNSMQNRGDSMKGNTGKPIGGKTMSGSNKRVVQVGDRYK